MRIGKGQTTISKEVKKHLKAVSNETIKKVDSTGETVAMAPYPNLFESAICMQWLQETTCSNPTSTISKKPVDKPFSVFLYVHSY